jgi:hypothetical protein
VFGTAYFISILKSLPKFQATILISCWVEAATDRQTQTYRSIIYRGSYYRAKYIFTVEELCGNLLGLDISVMIKFKSGDTEKFTKC